MKNRNEKQACQKAYQRRTSVYPVQKHNGWTRWELSLISNFDSYNSIKGSLSTFKRLSYVQVRCGSGETQSKVIYPKYSKHWPYTVASTTDCGCHKISNHGLNHGFFLSLFKLIPCPIHWIVCVLAYLNFIFEF